MSSSPIPTPRENQAEIFALSPDIRKSPSADETSIADITDLPVLYKPDERKASVASHIDENNENEAVCQSVSSSDLIRELVYIS